MPRTFGGETFDPKLDEERLRRQLAAVWSFMSDGQWHTLARIAAEVDAPEASVSARLRDFRKPKFGGHTVLRERIPLGNGLHRYRVIPRKPEQLKLNFPIPG
jgi:hypothetical protein